MAALSGCRLAELDTQAQAEFFAWIEGMTPADDGEDGPDFAAWLRHHAAVPGDETWVFFDPAFEPCVATASLVAQDRALAAPPGGWVLAGVNVARHLRGRGYGAGILAFVETELSARAARTGRSVDVLLQAENAVAVRLYAAFGYAPLTGRAGVYGKSYAAHAR